MTLAYRPLIEVPPPCNIPTAAGWCVLPEQHTGSHVPIPATYPPTPTTPAGMSGGEPLIPAGPHWFNEAMRLPGATLDNVSDGSTDYDGPRCVDADCRVPVPDDGELCEECADQPHAFVPGQGHRWPDWCVCGRIRSIGGYSPVHTDDEGGER